MGEVVIKIGGGEVADPERRMLFARDLADLVGRGVRLIVLHGGGPQATDLTRRLGLHTTMVGGRRVTSPEVLEVVSMALAGTVSTDLTAACRAVGVRGLGLSGVSAGLVRARKRPARLVTGGGDVPVDYGEVGDVLSVDADALRSLLDAGFVPLMSSLAASDTGRVLNINADVVACQAAVALQADALILLTGANGVMGDLDDPDSRYEQLTVAAARALIADGTVQGGMIPKLEEAFAVLEAGVGRVCILPAGVAGAAAAALAGDTALGTTLIA